MKDYRRASRVSSGVVIVSAAAICMVVVGAVKAARLAGNRSVAVTPASAELVGEVRDGRWETIRTSLAGVNEQSPAVFKLLAGHAALAENHTDAAFCLFKGVREPELAAWTKWTAELSKTYPGSAAARYLNGDAFSRQCDWAGAERELSAAIDIDPQMAVALAARGLARLGLGNIDSAMEDCKRAEASAPRLSVGYIAEGSAHLWYYTAPGALAAFTNAAEQEPDSSLIRLGLACSLAVNGRSNDAVGDVNKVAATSCCVASLASENAPRIVALSRRSDPRVRLAVKMQTQVEWNAFIGDMSPRNAAKLGHQLADLKVVDPQLGKFYENELTIVVNQHPNMRNTIINSFRDGLLALRNNGDFTYSGGVTTGFEGGALLWKGNVSGTTTVTRRLDPAVRIETMQELSHLNSILGISTPTRPSDPIPQYKGVSVDVSSRYSDPGNWGFQVPYCFAYSIPIKHGDEQ